MSAPSDLKTKEKKITLLEPQQTILDCYQTVLFPKKDKN